MKTLSGKEVGDSIVKRLFNAEKYALVCYPFISQYYAHALTAMAFRDVAVKVLTSKKQIEKDFDIFRYFAYTKKAAGLNNFHFLVVGREDFNHSKMFIIDDNYAVTGSANLTKTGMWKNGELIHIFDDPVEIAGLKTHFEKFWIEARSAIYNSKPQA